MSLGRGVDRTAVFGWQMCYETTWARDDGAFSCADSGWGPGLAVVSGWRGGGRLNQRQKEALVGLSIMNGTARYREHYGCGAAHARICGTLSKTQ